MSLHTRKRPPACQAGPSAQSEPVADRAALDAHTAEIEARFGAGDDGPPIPRPPHWGGYRIALDRVEFWQGQPNRLHDRFEYRLVDDAWEIRRLSP